MAAQRVVAALAFLVVLGAGLVLAKAPTCDADHITCKPCSQQACEANVGERFSGE